MTDRTPRDMHDRRNITSPTAFHILFGSLELLLDELVGDHPDRAIVRVERINRSRAGEIGGRASVGVIVTARRRDEVFSAWVLIGRATIDPWGGTWDSPQWAALVARWTSAHAAICAEVAARGLEVRSGVHLLPDACYEFAATAKTILPAGDGPEQSPAADATPTPATASTPAPSNADGRETRLYRVTFPHPTSRHGIMDREAFHRLLQTLSDQQTIGGFTFAPLDEDGVPRALVAVEGEDWQFLSLETQASLTPEPSTPDEDDA